MSSAQVQGQVGSFQIEWVSPPHGRSGESLVNVKQGGKVLVSKMRVRWKRDERGIWIEFPDRVRGYDLTADPHEDLGRVFEVQERMSAFAWRDLAFARAGLSPNGVGGSANKKKTLKVKSQMPGKIVRLMVEEGSRVEKDQPILVMEAMKMENEIRSPISGFVKKVSVSVGSAVETGAELILLDSGGETA